MSVMSPDWRDYSIRKGVLLKGVLCIKVSRMLFSKVICHMLI